MVDRTQFRTSPFGSRVFSTRTKSRVVFITCEGKTELDYFKSIANYDGYKDSVSVQPVDKLGPDRDDSDRLSMIQMAVENRIYQATGQIPLRFYISMVIAKYIDNFRRASLKEFGMKVKDLRELLRIEVRDRYNERYDKPPYTKGGLVLDPPSLSDRVIEDCNEALGKEKGYFRLEDDSIRFPKKVKPGEKNDFYVVFDRDFHGEFSNHQHYDSWLKSCSDNDIHPVVSTPCFELWLYMHWENPDYGKPSFRKQYGDELKKKIIARENPDLPDWEVEMIVKDKGDKCLADGTPTRFELFYKDRINDAIAESTRADGPFVTDPDKLKDNPGTMVGLFLKDLIKQS